MPFENSPQGPNGHWQGPEGWWQNVLDIAGQVAQVVGPLVPVVLGALSNTPGERQPFRTTGPVNWYLTEQDGQRRILVENNDPNEVSLSFTGFNQEIKKSSAQLVALGPASQTAPDVATQDITDIVRDFTIEQMPNPYVAMVTANRDRTGVSLLNTRMISTVLADLLVGRPLAIPGGLTVELRRNQSTHGYELVISGAVAVINMQYTIIVRGQAISGTAPATTGREANQQLVIPVPAAFSFELVDSVRLYYEVPLTVYEQEGRRTRGRRSAAALASA
jgi:hypothetical protein